MHHRVSQRTLRAKFGDGAGWSVPSMPVHAPTNISEITMQRSLLTCDALEHPAINVMHFSLYKKLCEDVDTLSGVTNQGQLEARQKERMQILYSDAMQGCHTAVTEMNLCLYRNIIHTIDTFERVTFDAETFERQSGLQHKGMVEGLRFDI